MGKIMTPMQLAARVSLAMPQVDVTGTDSRAQVWERNGYGVMLTPARDAMGLLVAAPVRVTEQGRYRSVEAYEPVPRAEVPAGAWTRSDCTPEDVAVMLTRLAILPTVEAVRV